MSAGQTHRFVMNFRYLAHGSLCANGSLFSSAISDPANPMRLLSAIAFLTLFAVAFAGRDAAPLPAAARRSTFPPATRYCTRSSTSPTATARFLP